MRCLALAQAWQDIVPNDITSACIALTFLYKINCIVGFGDQFLEKFFPRTKEHMQENEIMLQKILEQILEGSLK